MVGVAVGEAVVAVVVVAVAEARAAEAQAAEAHGAAPVAGLAALRSLKSLIPNHLYP